MDTSAYFPRQVEAVAEVIGDAAYALISSISVLRDPVAPGTDEAGPLWELEGPEPETIDSAEVYGALKVLCERAAEHRMPGRVLVVRPGLVVGPHDHTDRFTHWPRRVSRGGRMLAAEPDQPVQFIDARDLAAFVADGVEEGRSGVFNATGPAEALTMEALLETARDVTGSDADVVWAGEEFLLSRGVEPWDDLPLWMPRTDWGFLQVDCSKANDAGLSFRTVTETITETLEWDVQRPFEDRRDAMPRDREEALLAEILRSR
jgi:2'-hydroxyisoflavone reductase